MMGVQVASAQLFYDFCLDDHVPSDHLLRSIDRHLDLDGLRQTLKPFHSQIGRPSIDPELMIRMSMVGYCMGIRSERRLCDEVHLNLAYRWFCRLGLDGRVPDHSTFSKNRHGRFRESEPPITPGGQCGSTPAHSPSAPPQTGGASVCCALSTPLNGDTYGAEHLRPTGLF
jgi:transposase